MPRTTIIEMAPEEQAHMLVDCSISFGTNCSAFLFCPGVHGTTWPGPTEGMRKAVIGFWPAGREMGNQLLWRLAIKPGEVLVGQGAQQQLGLVEPTGVGRGVQGAQARMSSEGGFGGMLTMRGAILHDQRNASCVPIAASPLPHAPQKVLGVGLVQTPALHRVLVDGARHLKGDRPMPVILKLVSLKLAWRHGLPGPGPRQGLEVRFFVHTDHYFPALAKPLDTLITPQALRGPGGQLLIKHGGLPIAAPMRLQTRLR